MKCMTSPTTTAKPMNITASSVRYWLLSVVWIVWMESPTPAFIPVTTDDVRVIPDIEVKCKR